MFFFARVSSGELYRKIFTHRIPASMTAAASLTKSPVTSASCVALRSASLWAWPWTVSVQTHCHICDPDCENSHFFVICCFLHKLILQKNLL